VVVAVELTVEVCVTDAVDVADNDIEVDADDVGEVEPEREAVVLAVLLAVLLAVVLADDDAVVDTVNWSQAPQITGQAT
jgi:hypothetical protein